METIPSNTPELSNLEDSQKSVSPSPIKPNPFNNPKIIIIVIVLLFTVLGMSTFIIFNITTSKFSLSVAPTPSAKLLGASLVLFEGETEYEKGDQGWKTPSADLVLSEGDRIRVLSAGRAIISFDDGSVVRLNANSVVRLVSLKPNKIEIANEKGEVYARVVKSQRVFLVTDGKVTYESLGTAYKTLNRADEKDVEVYHSKVKVSTGESSVIVDEGNKYSPQTEKTEKLAAAEVRKDDFTKWNKEEDEKTSEFKKELGFLEQIVEPSPTLTPIPTKKTEAVVQNSSLILSAQKVENGVRLHWDVSNLSAPLGFKIVKNDSPDPIYPGNAYQYISNPGQRDYTWEIKDGKTYHFRVCVYTGEGCSFYSNDASSSTPQSTSATGKVTSITVKHDGGSTISWSIDGYSSKGFKVVWSQNAEPTYPTREGDKYDYFDDPERRSDSLTSFSGSGKYFVRVCEYLGGACGVYSNQIEVTF